MTDSVYWPRRLISSIELKLVLAWIAVLLLTNWADPNHTYWNQPGSSAELILRNTVQLGFFALGSAIVIISGGIDLSSGSVIVLSSTTFASLVMLLDPQGYVDGNWSLSAVAMAFVGAMLVGVMVGTLHAWLVTRVGLPPFIATLATLVGLRSLSRGITLAITSGKSEITFTDDGLRDTFKSLWSYSILFLIVAAALWFLMSKTVVGRRIYAMGGNEQAVRLSGIRTDRLKWLAYTISAVASSLVGIIIFADVSTAKPDSLARGYELNAIAASVIGGCSLQGGIGTIPGVMLGCLLLRTIIDAVNKVVRDGADIYEGMVVGIVVVLAVTFTQKGTQAIRRRLFSDGLGLCMIPVLGLLAGIVGYLFLRSNQYFQGYHAIVIGIATTALLIARAVWERRVLDRTSSAAR